jgi:hypothetical protein
MFRAVSSRRVIAAGALTLLTLAMSAMQVLAGGGNGPFPR